MLSIVVERNWILWTAAAAMPTTEAATLRPSAIAKMIFRAWRRSVTFQTLERVFEQRDKLADALSFTDGNWQPSAAPARGDSATAQPQQEDEPWPDAQLFTTPIIVSLYSGRALLYNCAGLCGLDTEACDSDLREIVALTTDVERSAAPPAIYQRHVRDGRRASIRRHRSRKCLLWKHRSPRMSVQHIELLDLVFGSIELTLRLASGPHVLPAPFSTVPFRQDPDFVDRGDILTQIDQRCSQPGGCAALVGLSGVG
jgi:hypothetical protein